MEGRKTIKQLQEGYAKKKFSVREVVDDHIAKIEKEDAEINAFITKTFDVARKNADEADRKVADYKGDAFKASPLLGVPIAHKDLYLTRGIKTTAASKVLEDYIPQYSATVVERLENAGAIMLGKLNCDAWGHGASGENSDFGPTRNPVNKDYVPGGSSSGSAAAVAAGFVALATSTDTGGSTRQPASFCGVVGIKPTYGRVSRYGVVSMASSMDTMGHITRRVEDAARVLFVTAGNDEHDATSVAERVQGYTPKDGINGLKIGLPKEYFSEGVEREVKETVMEAAKKLEEMGASVQEISLPHTEYVIPVYYIIMSSEVSSNLARYDGIRYGSARQNFRDEARRRIMLGTYSLSSGYKDKYYGQATSVRKLITQDFQSALNKVDVLLAPVSPTPPFRFGEKTDDPLKMYLSDVLTAGVNLAGLPGLAIPCGQTRLPSPGGEATGGQAKIGLPIGMQFIGKYFDEATLFRVGLAYENNFTKSIS